MAKIHIKGGSPLRLRFEDDDGATLKNVRLDGPGGWYFVDDEHGNRLECKPRKGGGNCFDVTRSDKERIDLEYES